MTATATVNNIVPMSFVDGPGNRTAIFLQGCNFRCLYCHNPETIAHCNHCGHCVPGCPTGALTAENGRVCWQAALCCGCGACQTVCPHSASPRVRHFSAAQAMEEAQKNRPFIRGITVSGGECSLQRGFVLELFTLAKRAGLSTLMDSNGGLPLAQDSELLAVCDGVMLDVKAVDAAFHRELTGHGNETVLQNAVALAQCGKLAEVRTVALPHTEQNRATVQGLGRLLGPHAKDVPYKLIRFRPLGVRGEAAGWPTPGDEEMEALRTLALQSGFGNVRVV